VDTVIEREYERMIELVLSWLTFLGVFLGVPLSYYSYLRAASKKVWNLKTDEMSQPTVTIMVPMHNEERTVELKLRNLAKLQYPRGKLEILLVDDGSTDETHKRAEDFLKLKTIDVKIVTFQRQNGKINSLNKALPEALGDLIIITDSDIFLSPDILLQTVPFFSDPSIGAAISREELLSPDISWVSQTEKVYYDLVYGTIKLGESKIHSTIMFHGGFAAYRRSLLDKFNVDSDDTGTALDIVQNGYRTILIPNAKSYGLEFVSWKDKSSIKVRRAKHNIKTWLRCFRLLVHKRLLLPMKIAIPELFLYLFNPMILLALLLNTAILIYYYPVFTVIIACMLAPLLIIKRTRLLFVETLQNNFFLLFGLLSLTTGKDIILWNPSQDTRIAISLDILEREQLA
jgi:cellulose synthase/poly-beta-1,6-N-acetylglucosamine synthase-like glycosyltransferase